MSRKPLKLIIDLAIWTSSIPVAYFLRLDIAAFHYLPSIFAVLCFSLPIQILLAFAFRIDRHSWHRISTRELPAIGYLVAIWILCLYGIEYYLPTPYLLPRSVPLIAGFLSILSFAGTRLGYRYYFESSQHRRNAPNQIVRVLVVGAGDAGVMLAKEMLRHPESSLRPIGFLDDDRNKHGQRILGVPVFGPLSQLQQRVAENQIDEVLIAIPSASGSVIREIATQCREIGVRNRTIPGIFDLLSGSISISQLREVEVEDLLRREPARLAIDEIAQYISGKTILVTGAGGSIGSELVRQVIRFKPKQLILLGRGENSIYDIEREVRGKGLAFDTKAVICDVRDRTKLERVFELYRPEVIFHAAAHKHVPLMEMNPDEAILNNVGGTKNLVDLSLKYTVETFVNISTDKAVNPTSVMGASKRIAEQVVLWGARADVPTAHPNRSFVSVRFGNVLGSRGSVVPLFKEQIRKREPITITHPDMVRYFMTIPEATQLVLQAGGMNERGMVYVLDMGEPVKISDLAKDLIQLSGLTLGEDIEIIYTGLRPGEKLFEELLTAEENSTSTKNSKIFSSSSLDAVSASEFPAAMEKLFQVAKNGDTQSIREEVLRFVPSYRLPEKKS